MKIVIVTQAVINLYLNTRVTLVDIITYQFFYFRGNDGTLAIPEMEAANLGLSGTAVDLDTNNFTDQPICHTS